MAHDVFISYPTLNRVVADAVCGRMEAAGICCWMAPRDVTHGNAWDQAVADAVTAAKLLVVIFSAAANASPNVIDEVAMALDNGSTVIPFRIEGVQPIGALRLRLGRVQWLDAVTEPLDTHIDKLIDSISRNLSRVVPGWPEVQMATNLKKQVKTTPESDWPALHDYWVTRAVREHRWPYRWEMPPSGD